MVTVVVMGLTFVLTTALHAALLVWFVVRPIAEHIKENGVEASRCLSEHIILPVFGKRKSDTEHTTG
jgi:hypothetical protein